jgi:hypothetical protein
MKRQHCHATGMIDHVSPRSPSADAPMIVSKPCPSCDRGQRIWDQHMDMIAQMHAKPRTCLVCGDMFLSPGPAYRRCETCARRLRRRGFLDLPRPYWGW